MTIFGSLEAEKLIKSRAANAKLAFGEDMIPVELTTEEILKFAVEAIARLEREVEKLGKSVRDAEHRASSALSRLNRNGLR